MMAYGFERCHAFGHVDLTPVSASQSFIQTATNPLERIKMLSQTGEHGATSKAAGNSNSGSGGALQLYRAILRQEGVLGLWAGNGANLLRVFPAKAVVFATNDTYRAFLVRTFLNPARQDSDWMPVVSFAAGGMAGASASVATYPLDLARGRISGKMARDAGTQKAYRGIFQTVALTVKDEGFRALYKGVTPTLLGAVPYEGIKFGTVGVLERVFPVDDAKRGADTTAASQAPWWRKMIFGGAGGVMAGLITYPNDTVRRLLQMQGSRQSSAAAEGIVYRGYWDCVRQTYHQHGLRRFYRGLTINLVRMAPNTAVQFGSYELLKQWTADWI